MITNKQNQNTMKTYKVLSSIGWRFSFNAKDYQDAKSKLYEWLRYHGMLMCKDEFSVEETTDTNCIHNEYVD